MVPIYTQTTLQLVHTKSQPFVKIKPLLFHKHVPLGGATADFTMKHINLRHITTTHFSDRSRFPRYFCVNNNKIAPHSIMSDQEKNISQSETTTAENNNNNNVGVKAKQVEIPPPPEKPLPGDCCGSGCVRCVWDIYYEELDDYDNLVKNNLSGCDSVKNDKGSS